MAYRRGRYYYRSKREGQRVVTEYLGGGEIAELTAQIDARERQREAEERVAIRAEKERQREIDRAIDTASDLLRELTQAVLVASGYHTHKGQWRRRRDDPSDGR